MPSGYKADGSFAGKVFKNRHSVSTKMRMKMSKSKIGKKRIDLSGKNHWNWGGGKTLTPQGYILIYMPQHPFCTQKKYVFKHRLVIEKQIKRYLKPEEISHHLNEIKDDNRPANLIVFTSVSAHMKFHHNPNNVKPSEIIFDGRYL